MKIGIAGTPGTGKTSVAEKLDKEVLSMKVFAKERGLGEQNDLFEIDVEAVEEELPEEYWIEGHLVHKLDLDYCIILRTRPDILENRLNQRGYSESKVKENVEAEAMDLILSEASERNFSVYEIDTSEKNVELTAKEIREAVSERKEKSGIVDWMEYL